MSSNNKTNHSNRFILSASGLALVAMILAITAQAGRANIPDASRSQVLSGQYSSSSSMHSSFPTGDINFDYAANMRMHHQVAIEMSQAQIRNGSNKLLRNMAMHIIAEHNNEIAKLDRWMAAHTKAKSNALLSSR